MAVHAWDSAAPWARDLNPDVETLTECVLHGGPLDGDVLVVNMRPRLIPGSFLCADQVRHRTTWPEGDLARRLHEHYSPKVESIERLPWPTTSSGAPQPQAAAQRPLLRVHLWPGPIGAEPTL